MSNLGIITTVGLGILGFGLYGIIGAGIGVLIIPLLVIVFG